LAFAGGEALLCGDGAAEFFTANPSPKLFIAPPQGRLQTAAGTCLAALSEAFIQPDQLEVSYLQKVKAEKDLEDRQKNIPKE
ncbi:MAG TPA: tRNA (adenosine(37)-N6)-threonylcarbamoyltransferase complex dimerization subunit type 1 TsaB, partial [Ruminococcus sp.]|nr:tRNA (adenosine(37)-N6)-threonylcarbamoyltransferase complex dimerization subunit type 1 TsaB [Ruminococcus sp.]